MTQFFGLALLLSGMWSVKFPTLLKNLRYANPNATLKQIIDASKADSNFIIYSFGQSGRDLLVNEIAPYTGTVIVTDGATSFVITAEGEWTIDLTE